MFEYFTEIKKDPTNEKIDVAQILVKCKNDKKINKFLKQAAAEIKSILKPIYEQYIKVNSTEKNSKLLNIPNYRRSNGKKIIKTKTKTKSKTSAMSVSLEGLDYKFSFEKFIKLKLHRLKSELPTQYTLCEHATEVFLSGQINEQMLFERFRKTLEHASNEWLIPFSQKKEDYIIKNPTHIHKHLVIKFDFHDEKNIYLLEYFLFQLLYMKVLYLNGFIAYLPRDIRIKIEIANSYTFSILIKLKLFSLIPVTECYFDLEIFEIPRHKYNNIQIVCAFLDRIKNNDKDYLPFIIKKKKDSQLQNFKVKIGVKLPEFDESEVKDLILEHFIERAKRENWTYLTFAHIIDFMKILSREFIISNYNFENNSDLKIPMRRRIINCLYNTCFTLSRSFNYPSECQKNTINKVK